MEQATQQVLDLQGPITPSFDNFITGDNQLLLGMLQNIAVRPEGWHYLHGSACSGKTHLLQAVMHTAIANGVEVHYLPLQSLTITAQLIDQLDSPGLLLIDDMHSKKNDRELQEALFHCLNRIHQAHQCILVASRTSVAKLSLKLPDLQSRLTKCQRHVILPLRDQDIAEFIHDYLQRWSIPISDDVLMFMQKKGPRNMQQLLFLLQRVVNSVLAQKREVTKALINQLI